MADNAKWFVVHTYSGYEDNVATNILRVAENRKMRDQILDVLVCKKTEETFASKSLNLVKISVNNKNNTFKKVNLVKFKIPQNENYFYYRGLDTNSDGRKILLAEEEIIDKISKVPEMVPHQFIVTKHKVDENTGEETATISFKKVTVTKVYPTYVFVKVACTYRKRNVNEDEELAMSDEVWYLIRNTRGVTSFLGPSGKPQPLSDSELAKLNIEKKEVIVSFNEGDIVNILNGPFDGHSGKIISINVEKETLGVEISMLGRVTPVDLSFDQVELAEF